MIKIDFQEKDIEDYLCNKNNLTKWFEDLIVIKRQFKIFDFYIDILAYHKLFKKFFIIELKKDELNSDTLAQVLRYKKCLECKYLNKKFKILLIGKNLNYNLLYLVRDFNSINESIIEDEDIFYQLYNYTFEHGINFNWICTQQQKIYEMLDDVFVESDTKRFLIPFEKHNNLKKEG
ncbi:hypothetical protein [Faecalibacillus faecis]|uniref:hypothetical protein n=1 Tax=Faecalibacillus faecis TaxID=1982628 RepID=UPI0038638493